jgi:hypothetical protein
MRRLLSIAATTPFIMIIYFSLDCKPFPSRGKRRSLFETTTNPRHIRSGGLQYGGGILEKTLTKDEKIPD